MRGAVRALVAAFVVAALGGPFAWLSDADASMVEIDEIPAWTTWAEVDLPADLDGDGVAAEHVELEEGVLSPIRMGNGGVFQPEDGWRVFDAMVADLNGDGTDELLLLVWKRGSYGNHMPFWETDDDSWSQHVFVFGMGDGGFKPLWMSSKLGVKVAHAEFEDGSLVLYTPDGSWTRWEWLNWGFTLTADSAGLLEPKEPEQYVYTYTHISSDANESSEEVATSCTLVFAGDNIAHRNVYESCYAPETGEFDFCPVYGQVSDYLGGFDFAGVCQETVLVPDPALASGYPEFGTPEQMGDALSEAGFDGVFCATNHVMDKGARGVESTLAYWNREHPDMLVAGIHGEVGDAGGAQVRDVAGFKVAILNATYGLNGHDPQPGEEYLVDTLDDWDALMGEVVRAEGAAEFTVVYLHAGEEYSSKPTGEQERLVADCIDAGADLVVCSHAHVLAPFGAFETPAGNEGLVYWGLGNFVASQGRAECQLGGLATMTLERDSKGAVRVAECDLVPTVCHVAPGGRATVYLLDDYTDDLAVQMSLLDGAERLDVAGYRGLFLRETLQG